jgi:hypothetical protein
MSRGFQIIYVTQRKRERKGRREKRKREHKKGTNKERKVDTSGSY